MWVFALYFIQLYSCQSLLQVSSNLTLLIFILYVYIIIFLNINFPFLFCFISSTTLEYSLDQLFIHLDDTLPDMQHAVYKVILVISRINKDLVIQKASLNKESHRSPDLCNKIIFEVKGIEILDS